jgi:8-oxo-dGTP diphosphatase
MIVVAVALIDSGGRVLLQKRRYGAVHGGLWEFPGGKIEPGESPECALLREIAEELGIVPAAGSLLPTGFVSGSSAPEHDSRQMLILLYTCREWAGEPRALDAQALDWFRPDEMADLAMPPLDYPLARALLSAI